MPAWLVMYTSNDQLLTGIMIKECILYEEQFAALLEGELTCGEKTAMQRHVEECPYCRQELFAMKRHWDAVEQWNLLALKPKNKKPKKYRSKFKQLMYRLLKIIWPPA